MSHGGLAGLSPSWRQAPLSWRLARGPAGAAFSRGGLLDGGFDVCCPQVASDADGDAIAVWIHPGESGNRVVARSISAARERGPLMRLSGTNPGPTGLPAPDVASDADGDAIAVFSRRGPKNWRAKARMIAADGVLGTPITLSAKGGDAFSAQIASDTTGDAVAVWRRFDGTNWRVQARTISRSGALGPILTLSAAGEDAQGGHAAIDADGDAVAVWQRFDGTKLRAQARTISRSGALGPIRNLSVAGEDAYSGPSVAIDAEGDALAVWASTPDLEESSDFGLGGTIESRSISRTGSLGTITRLASCGFLLPGGPGVASDADGDAIAIWTDNCATGGDPGLFHGVETRRISRTGMLGPIITVTEPLDEEGLAPGIAIDADGDAVVIWSQFYFGACAGASDVIAVPISKAGVLGPRSTLSGVGPLCTWLGYNAQIASDADGDVVAVWDFEGNSDNSGIRISHGP